MRTITGNIKNYPNKTVTFFLKNKYGHSIYKAGIDSTVEANTDASGNFTVELYETEDNPIAMHYKMVLDTGMPTYNIFVRAGTTPINFKNLLSPEPTLKPFFTYDEITQSTTIDINTINIMTRFFAGETEYMRKEEKELIEMYIYQADNGLVDEVIKKLDEQLSKIGIGE